MSRVAFVNGQYVPHSGAAVHVEDRGYQFADGVYEVCEVRDGNMIDMPGHLTRLNRSLGELRIARPMETSALKLVLREVVRRNRVKDGLVYLQVTRGVARRDHYFPKAGTPPSIVITSRSSNRAAAEAKFNTGVGVVTTPDNRWERVDIKSVSLLPNVLARQKAKEAGAVEAWFIDEDGFVTEGASTNAWIVTDAGEIVTRPADKGILCGITRRTVMKVAEELQIKVVERPFTIAEAHAATESFITAATTLVTPVIRVDGKDVGTGQPGPVTKRLREMFHTIAAAEPVYI